VPRVLDTDGVRAVIAQVLVGLHLGWVVSYFGPRLPAVEGIGRWGGNWAPSLDGDGVEYSRFSVTDNDYELASYLKSGKLLWVAPDDDTATLREGVDGCPYLGLDGPQEAAYITRGNARYPRAGEADAFSGLPCLRVEFDGTGMPPSQLDRLRALLDLEPIGCLPEGREALAGFCNAAEYLPPGTDLLLHQASPWRLTVVYRGEQPSGAALDPVRLRLLDTLTRLGLAPGEIRQLSASGRDWDRYEAERSG
jgi:hypothetical protein